MRGFDRWGLHVVALSYLHRAERQLLLGPLTSHLVHGSMLVQSVEAVLVWPCGLQCKHVGNGTKSRWGLCQRVGTSWGEAIPERYGVDETWTTHI